MSEWSSDPPVHLSHCPQCSGQYALASPTGSLCSDKDGKCSNITRTVTFQNDEIADSKEYSVDVEENMPKIVAKNSPNSYTEYDMAIETLKQKLKQPDSYTNTETSTSATATDIQEDGNGSNEIIDEFSYKEILQDVRASPGNSMSDIEILRAMLQEREDLLKEYAAKVHSLETQTKTENKKLQVSNLTRDKLQSEVDVLKSQLRSETLHRDTLEIELKSLRNQVKKIDEEKQKVDPEKSFLRSNLEETQEENELLKSSLKSKSDLLEAVSNRLNSKDEMMLELNEELQYQVETYRNEAAEALKQLEEANKEQRLTNDKISSLRNETNDLRNKLKDREVLLNAVKEECRHSDLAYEELLDKFKEMTTKSEQKSEQIDQLKKEIKSYKRFQSKDSEFKERLKNEIDKEVKEKEKTWQDVYKKKLKKEIETIKSSISKDLKAKHAKELEENMKELEESRVQEVDSLRQDLEEQFNQQLHENLMQTEENYKQTMEKYQEIINTLELKVSGVNKYGNVNEVQAEVECMLQSLTKYASGTTQTICLDVSALNTPRIKQEFQMLTTKIFELIDEVSFLQCQCEHHLEIRKELESKLSDHCKEYVPVSMYRELHSEYLSVLRHVQLEGKKTENIEKDVNSINETSFIESLRKENLQLLEDKLRNEQRLNQLENDLIAFKEKQTNEIEVNALQVEINELKQQKEDLEEVENVLKRENAYLLEELDKAINEKNCLAIEVEKKQINNSQFNELRESIRTLTCRSEELLRRLENNLGKHALYIDKCSSTEMEDRSILDEVRYLQLIQEELEKKIFGLPFTNTTFTQTQENYSAESKVSNYIVSEPTQRNKEIYIYKPYYIKELTEKKLIEENSHLFAVNTKLFTEREKLREEVFRREILLNHEIVKMNEERDLIRSKLKSQKYALQNLSSKVRMFSYQSSSTTDLELKMKRELLALEQQIGELVQSFHEQEKINNIISNDLIDISYEGYDSSEGKDYYFEKRMDKLIEEAMQENDEQKSSDEAATEVIKAVVKKPRVTPPSIIFKNELSNDNVTYSVTSHCTSVSDGSSYGMTERRYELSRSFDGKKV